MEKTFYAEDDILDGLLLSSKEKPTEELNWRRVDELEKEKLKTSASFDLDFLGFSGSALSLINNEKLCDFLGHASFKFFSSCSLQIARCSLYKRLLVYGKCGDYLIGEPIGSFNLNDEDEIECGEVLESCEPHKTQV